jgi:hypothetical protein
VRLRRYCKGHTAEECAAAARAVLEAGGRLEIGFVMFDPLCTLAELADNTGFLLENDLARYTSGPTSELRLQVGSRYLAILERAERESSRRLYLRQLDPNTLSFPYEYRDPAVARLAEVVRQDNERSHPLIYRLKGLTRFGSGAIVEDATKDVRRALGDYRTATIAALASSIQRGADAYAPMAREALARLALDFVRIIDRHPDDRPLVTQAVQRAEAELSAVR